MNISANSINNFTNNNSKPINFGCDNSMSVDNVSGSSLLDEKEIVENIFKLVNKIKFVSEILGENGKTLKPIATKIGDATIKTDKKYDELKPNCHELNQAAISRIKEYTQTAGISFQLLHAEIAVYTVNNPKSKHHGLVKAFRDHDVHNVLKRSGITNKNFHGGKEWFECDLNTAINAIRAVKGNKSSLNG